MNIRTRNILEHMLEDAQDAIRFADDMGTALSRPRSLGQKSQTPVFWRVFRHTSLNSLEIKQLFLREFALPGKKLAQNPSIQTFVPGS